MTTKYSDEDVFRINIGGSASFTRLADRAYVRLAVTHTLESKAKVADKVLTAARAIEEHIKIIQIKYKQSRDEKPSVEGEDTSLPLASWSKTSLTAVGNTEYDRRDGTKIHKTFTARMDFDLRFRDFAALGEFAATASGMDYCEVESVEWYLLDSTKKAYETRLRRDAAADALTKVKDYCAVFLPGVKEVEIKPVNLIMENGANGQSYFETMNTATRARTLMAMPSFSSKRTDAAGGSGGEFVFTPQECKMQLTIDMNFIVKTAGWTMTI